MSLFGRKVLVTGGTGFIGGRLVEKLILEHQAQVRVLVRDFRYAARIARFPVEMIGGDVTDARALGRAMEGCDAVIHCAVGSRGTRTQQRATTVGGTEAVAKASLAAKVQRLVHLSTISVYGLPGDGDLDETAPRRRTGDFYSDAKLDAEQTVLRYHREQGLPVVVIQPTIVYGPFSKPWTAWPIEQLRESQVVLVDGGSGFCNAVYVDDVADAVLLAAERDEAIGQDFLISGESPVTWRDFYDSYEHMLGFTSTASMSLDEIKAERAKQRKANRTISQIMRVVRRDARMRARLLKLPAIGLPCRILASVTPEWAWTRLTTFVTGGAKASGVPDPTPQKPLALPDPYWIQYFCAKTRVRIDKAKCLLGFTPAFDFRRGMQMTSAWIDWANLKYVDF